MPYSHGFKGFEDFLSWFQAGSSAFAQREVKAELSSASACWMRGHSPKLLVTPPSPEAGEPRDRRRARAVLSNATTVMARNQAVSWQGSPCYSILSASYERGIFLPALSTCLMNSQVLQRGCWHSCQLTPFVMYTNDCKVFTQPKQHVLFHSLLSWVQLKLVTGNRCEKFFNLELFPSSAGIISRDLFEDYWHSSYCWKNDQGRQRSVFRQCPSKSHSFLSIFDTIFPQDTQGITLYRSLRNSASVHVSAPIDCPGCHRDLRSLHYCYVDYQESKEKWTDLPSPWDARGSGRQG